LNREKHDIYEKSGSHEDKKQEYKKNDEGWNLCIEIGDDKSLNEEGN